jgi:predicted transposase/invertase (TIGR01784 family)
MILKANADGLREVMKMSDAALEAVFEEYGLTEKWEKRGIEQGEEDAKLLIARNLVNMGWKIEDVAKTTELDISKIQPLYGGTFPPDGCSMG